MWINEKRIKTFDTNNPKNANFDTKYFADDSPIWIGFNCIFYIDMLAITSLSYIFMGDAVGLVGFRLFTIQYGLPVEHEKI